MKQAVNNNTINVNEKHLQNINVLLANINKKNDNYSSIIQSIQNFVKCEFIKIEKKIKKALLSKEDKTPITEWANYIYK